MTLFAPRQLLAILADAAFHPLPALQAHTDMDTSQLAQAIDRLRATGLMIEQHPQHGYRLATRIEPLSGEHIRAAMQPDSTALLGELSLQLQTDSTNSQLRRMLNHGAAPGSACLSESQSAGRGRRGRQWISPAGSSLILSLSWRYHADEDLDRKSVV